MAKTEPFEKHFKRYEDWFVENKFAYLSELKALEEVIPKNKKGIEIGVGSGLFAKPLGIKFGVEPSAKMRKLAIERGIDVKEGVAENLPYQNNSFDFALMVTTICFVDDIEKSFLEIKRILKPMGKLILGFVDKDSEIGKIYLKNKEKSVFYKNAEFYSVGEVKLLLSKTGYMIDSIHQTLFGNIKEINEIQNPIKGYGKGSFVVITAIRN